MPERHEHLRRAALLGLLGAAGWRCEEQGDGLPRSGDDRNGTPRVLSRSTEADLTFDGFATWCEDEGGLVQTHALCAGANACAGMSFNKHNEQLSVHTCRATNSCGGVSCVVLPEDRGREADVVLKQACAGCHGDPFTLYVHPDRDLVEAADALAAADEATLVHRIAFGIAGVNTSGTAYANMPGMHDRVSLAEIRRVVAALQEEVPDVAHYGIPGETEDFP